MKSGKSDGMNVLAVDYSLNSPAATVYSDTKKVFMSVANSNKEEIVEAVRDNGRHIILFDNYMKSVGKDNFSKAIRFYEIVNNLIKNTISDEETILIFEGYAFGAVSHRIFQMAEACGVVKHELVKNNNIYKDEIYSVAPSTVKKFFTGSGRSDKKAMCDKYLEGCKLPLDAHVSVKKSFNDVVDSFAIAEYAIHKNFILGD